MMNKKNVKYVSVVVIAVALVVFHMQVSKLTCMQEKAFDERTDISVDEKTLENALESVAVDGELGAPYNIYTMKVFLNGKRGSRSTLIEYPVKSSPRIQEPDSNIRGIILYVHGYNDYFFQKELAEKADSAGYAFFAVDLHYCGRSYAMGELRNDMRNIKEYYAELDEAIMLSRAIVKRKALKIEQQNEKLPYVMIGHSLGGLITSLYVGDRPDAEFAAVVLNSPFLDMNYSWSVRNIVLPVISEFALYAPDISIGSTGEPNYAYSLMRESKGEWEYNPEMKRVNRPDIFLGWLRAVYRGQLRVRDGLNIKSPVLVMHGDCSVKDEEWVDEYTHCDGVLDIEHIEKWGLKLGPRVVSTTIHDGLHDLYLSREDVRNTAYQATFDFIGANIRPNIL